MPANRFRTFRDWALMALGLFALWIVAQFLIHVDVVTFRRSLESRLVLAADRATSRVDLALRSRSQQLQERLVSVAPGDDRASALVAELEVLRATGDFTRLTLIRRDGTTVFPMSGREVSAGRGRAPFRGALRRVGMLEAPGQEIRHLPASSPRGAPVLIGLDPTDFIAGHYWPAAALFAEVDRAADESVVAGGEFGLAVLATAGELQHATSQRDPAAPQLASRTLAVFPGWRLAAFPLAGSPAALAGERRRRSTGWAVLALGLTGVLAVARLRRVADDEPIAPGGAAARSSPAPSARIGETTVHFDRFELERNGTVHPLSAREAELLAALLESRGRVVRREELLERVWGYAAGVETRTLDTFIYRLRKKLETDPAHAEHLITVRGVGYKLV